MMPVDWIMGLLGGLMIGSAAAAYLLVSGRIMGASGILGGLLDGTNRSSDRVAFVLGLIATPSLIALAYGAPNTNVTSNVTLLVVGGVCVGLGTRIANGCTSGHGVCGMSRFSRRGIAATACYLGGGFTAMYLGRHVLGVL